VLQLIDSTGTGRVSYKDFSEGLRSAGIFLGDADRRSVWADAGGPLATGEHKLERVPGGELEIGDFLSRLEHSSHGVYTHEARPAVLCHNMQACVYVCIHIHASYAYICMYRCIGVDWARTRMEQAGYSRHMQSSLTKGLAVHEDAEEFDPTGNPLLTRYRLYYLRPLTPSLYNFLATYTFLGGAFLLFVLSRGRHAPAARGSFGTLGPSRQPTATKRSRDRFLAGPRVCVVK
jgi:hypothetical protein